MFNIDNYLNAPADDSTRIVNRGGEEFAIRRLNGAERLKFNDLSSQYDRVVYVLSKALLSGERKIPIGRENAVKFVERYAGLSDALFNDIFELTQESLAKDTEIWAESKKNSASQEATSDSSDSSVADTE